MEDPVRLKEELNRSNVKLLLTDADLALTFLDVAKSSQDEQRRSKALADARRAYQDICQKREQFTLADSESRALDIKLDRLRMGLGGD